MAHFEDRANDRVPLRYRRTLEHPDGRGEQINEEQDSMSTTNERQVPSPRKLAHAVFRTRDNYQAMIDWYCTVLGAEQVFSSPMLTFLSYDDEHHRIAIAHMPDLKNRDVRSIGMDHLAFTYGSLDDLLTTFERLKAVGIEPFCPVNHGPTTSLYYHDPDGNRIELQVDNFEDMHEATEHMNEAFEVNPVGVLFEPDALVRRRAEGAGVEELTRIPVADLEPPEPALFGKLMAD
jgi:catechol-2,3-dioxygenase